MREMAAKYPEPICALLPELAKISMVHHFKHHMHLLETIWKQLPAIAAGVGKRNFKRHLEAFFPALKYTLASDNHLAKSAAETCCGELGSLIGPSILLGRVEQAEPSLKPQVEDALQVPRQQMKKRSKEKKKKKNEERIGRETCTIALAVVLSIQYLALFSPVFFSHRSLSPPPILLQGVQNGPAAKQRAWRRAWISNDQLIFFSCLFAHMFDLRFMMLYPSQPHAIRTIVH